MMNFFDNGDPYIEWNEEIYSRDEPEPEYDSSCLHCLSKSCVGNCPESEKVEDPPDEDGIFLL